MVFVSVMSEVLGSIQAVTASFQVISGFHSSDTLPLDDI
jgi:hypothetical protein